MINTFNNGIITKENERAQAEFELSYYDVSNYATVILYLMHREKINQIISK